jgi:lipopolysaccharide/colanic/teichoic acid biosynthesis glycosyltransferase
MNKKINFILKRIADLLLTLPLAIIISPVLLLIALLIRLESRGPAFFIQKRLGLNGAVFSMIKFRTMVQGAEKMGTGLFSYERDPRITRLGRILRHTSLDELPQIFNVIKGDMALVGPRPPVTYELGDYTDFSDKLKFRFTVKPGITGLAQVAGRNELSWDMKLVYDTKYIRNFNRYGVPYDLYLILKTVIVVLSMRNVIEKPLDQK